MSDYKLVRGVRDITGDDALKLQHIINIGTIFARENAFELIQLPIIEYSELFERNLGDESDIVSKEIYKFQDKSNESIALRPELTAGNMRFIINNGLYHGPFPRKYFSYGPAFRYDRPQKGRYRQFYQLNYEVYGEIKTCSQFSVYMLMLYNLFIKLLGQQKTNSITFKINHLGSEECRKNYETALVAYLNKHINQLSDISKRRLTSNPLRILDSKELNDIEILKNAPKINTFWSENEVNFIQNIITDMRTFGVNIELDFSLVRGLDYYTGFVFEVQTSLLGAQSAIGGGGEYNNMLTQMLNKKNIKMNAFGFAIGVDRLMLLLDEFIDKTIKIGVIADNLMQFIKIKSMCYQSDIIQNREANLAFEFLPNIIPYYKSQDRAKQLNCNYITSCDENGNLMIKPLA